MRFSTIRRIVLLLAAIGLFVGCGREPPPALRLATYPFVGFEPFFLARDALGVVPKDVQLVEYVNQQQARQALLDGAVDAATLTLDEALQVAARAPDFKIAWVTDYCKGAYFIVAQSPIADLPSLKGKQIGLDDSLLSAHLLRRALQGADLTLQDVKIRTLSPGEQRVAFASGELDAIVAYDPIYDRRAAVGGNVLFDSRRLPVELSGVVLVRAKTLTDERLVALQSAWNSAVRLVADQPDDAAAKMAPRLRLDVAHIRAGIEKTHFVLSEDNRDLLQGRSPAYLQIAERMKDTLATAALLPAKMSVATLFLLRADGGP